MPAELIIAVDPGGTTGYSYITVQDGVFDAPAPKSGQLPPQEFCQWLDRTVSSFIHGGWKVTIVVERFTISARTLKVSRAGSYDALEVIGVCRYVSLRDCGRDLEMSAPSEVMNLFPDKKLKELGWYVPGQGHANDSLRHLARACAKRKLIRVASGT